MNPGRSQCSPVTGSSDALRHALQHRPHRHKKFHVRQEALGAGYETFNAQLPPALTHPPKPAVAPGVEWEGLPEEEPRRRAARNVVRVFSAVLAFFLVFLLFCRYSDWTMRFVAWLRHFPMLTQ
jgi:hypothetical protein